MTRKLPQKISEEENTRRIRIHMHKIEKLQSLIAGQKLRATKRYREGLSNQPSMHYEASRDWRETIINKGQEAIVLTEWSDRGDISIVVCESNEISDNYIYTNLDQHNIEMWEVIEA